MTRFVDLRGLCHAARHGQYLCSNQRCIACWRRTRKVREGRQQLRHRTTPPGAAGPPAQRALELDITSCSGLQSGRSRSEPRDSHAAALRVPGRHGYYKGNYHYQRVDPRDTAAAQSSRRVFRPVRAQLPQSPSWSESKGRDHLVGGLQPAEDSSWCHFPADSRERAAPSRPAQDAVLALKSSVVAGTVTDATCFGSLR